MSITVYGTAMRLREPAVHTRSIGNLKRYDGADVVNDLVDELDPVAVTLDHDDECAVGVLVFAEVDDRDQVNVVAVVDDAVAQITTPMYWSPEILAIGQRSGSVFRSDYGALVGLSLVANPAGLALPPVEQMPGDVRGSRGDWPLSWRSQSPDVLGRAADWHDQTWQRRTPTRLQRVRKLTRLGPNFYVDEQGEPVPVGVLPRRGPAHADRSGRTTGALWHRQGGAILSVR